MDDAEALMPVYLRFVKGVIDSSDLPLNVSRELLQESRDVKAIREGSSKRVLSMLEGLAESEGADEKEKYAAFWKDFGVVLKEGIGEDHANGERLAKLYRFASTHDDGSVQNVSLPDYVSRMKEGQEAIYYVTADTLATAKNSPQLEIFKKKGIEVLLFTDRVDEWLLSHLYEFDGHPLQSVAKGSVDLGRLEDEVEKKQAEEVATAFRPTLERLTRLYRFSTTHDDGSVQNVSLPDYVARIKEGQEAIYYVTADTLAGAKSSPQLEIFRKKGIEVLLLVDRVDEWMLSHLYEFDGKPLQSVAKGGVDLGKLQDEAEKKHAEEAAEAFKPVLERLKITLKDRAKDVRATTRLVDSPACIVVEEGDMSSHLARLLKQSGQAAPKGMPILEVNPEHALLKRLEASERFDDLALIIFDQALLAEGGQLEDPAAYVQRVNRLLTA